jgi:hypothetical protein
MSDAFLLRVVSGAELLTAVSVAVENQFTKSATDYWTLQVVRRRLKPDGRTPQDFGESVGAPYALNARTLPAKTSVTVYENAQGLRVGDGDRVYLQLTKTGNPAPLSHLTWEYHGRRITQ